MANQILDTDTSPMHFFFGPKNIAQTPEGVKRILSIENDQFMAGGQGLSLRYDVTGNG